MCSLTPPHLGLLPHQIAIFWRLISFCKLQISLRQWQAVGILTPTNLEHYNYWGASKANVSFTHMEFAKFSLHFKQQGVLIFHHLIKISDSLEITVGGNHERSQPALEFSIEILLCMRLGDLEVNEVSKSAYHVSPCHILMSTYSLCIIAFSSAKFRARSSTQPYYMDRRPGSQA